MSLLTVALLPCEASAFDYLEHSFFTDRACLEAQRRLLPLMAEGADEAVAARFLALAVACPDRWERPYCAGDYKQLTANLNLLEEEPEVSGDHSFTLGDFAALPDHVSQFGAIVGLPRASREGLTTEVLRWLEEGVGDPGGVLSDVAEDACETDGLVDWEEVERDIAVALATETSGGRQAVPAAALVALNRSPVKRGPSDPAGAYSFDNPHYLDLVLQNHHHFVDDAHASWLGFHSAAREIAERPCEALIALDAGDLEDVAEGLDGFEGVDWGELGQEALRREGCALIGARLHQRLARWRGRTSPDLAGPAEGWIARAAEDGPFRDRVVSATLGLIFEGAGLHFLQDSLSGGHVRIDRAAWELGNARHFHDADGEHGVAISVGTRRGHRELVAFGDGWLLGRAPARLSGPCPWESAVGTSPTTVSACLLREQRGLLVAASTASILDWSLGGVLFGRKGAAVDRACDGGEVRAFICDQLPTRPPAVGGRRGLGIGPPTLQESDLPEPPPPFAYQSLGASLGLDASGDGVQSGLRMVFLNELDARANWMTSYHVGLLQTLRDEAPPELLGEFSYMFHWRWAARFLINAGPFVYGGMRDFGRGVSAFSGLGPSAGLSLLPEGWTKIPLEITASYRFSLTLLDSAHGWSADAIGVEGHWVELTVGLAFFD